MQRAAKPYARAWLPGYTAGEEKFKLEPFELLLGDDDQ
jgi:hypothetical protein